MSCLRTLGVCVATLGLAAPVREASRAALRLENPLGRLPLRFEQNRGQAASEVKYLARGAGYTLSLASTEAVLGLRDGPQVRMRWAGANRRPNIEGLGRLPGETNYFLGRNPAKWRTEVPAYAKVRYQGLYPGIDLALYGQQGRLEYDFVVAPGADLNAARLDFVGARLRVDERGDLLVMTAEAELRQQRPRIYQETGGHRKAVPGGYRLLGDRTVGFEADGYDPALPLVVDPVLVYSTFLGGSGNESAFDVAVDAAGNVYVTGWTTSANSPLAGAYQRTPRGQDVFVTKINAAGNALVYSTYLGGGGADTAHDIAVDAAGNAYVTGETTSTDFPVLRAVQSAAENRDAFVTKLNATGSALLYSTYLGGSGADAARGIALDGDGNGYLTGITESPDFPTQNPIQASLNGTQDVFVTKLAATGSTLVYSTYLGGTAGDHGYAIAVDAARNAYVVGLTGSVAFPLMNPLQSRRGGQQDFSAFVSKLNPTGTALVYSTYLGGADNDHALGVAVNDAGEAWVAGRTNSTNFPTAKPIQAASGGGEDAFLAQLNAAGTALKFSTYLGGGADDFVLDLALDPAGNAYVAGGTESDDFPFKDALQPRRGADALVAKISAAGTIVYATPLGGSGRDGANALAADAQGNAYVAGYTFSSDFPTSAALQATFGGGTGESPGDAMVVKIAETGTPVVGPLSMVSAASFAADAVAPESIVSAYGQGLAAGLVVAESAALPENLGETTVNVTDSAGVERVASLFFVSPAQVNFLVPAGTAPGQARVAVLRNGQAVAAGNMNVAAVAPGLFTANANGKGVAAAWAQRFAGDGTQAMQLIFECAAAGQCIGVPVDPGPDADQVFLLLFGTGIRGRSGDAAVKATIGGVTAEVLGAVPQGQYPGLDQVNVRLPRTLAGKGEVNIVLTVDGKVANTVTVKVGGTAPPPPPPPPADRYLPLVTGMTWEYRVQIGADRLTPYLPIFEAPQGIICASVWCGMCSWKSDLVEFTVTVGERLSGTESYRVTVPDAGMSFYYCSTDPSGNGTTGKELRVRTLGNDRQLEVIAAWKGALEWRMVRPLARITPQDLNQTQTLAVPAGEFKDVIKTSLTLTGDGSYVRGTYPTEVYLAPDVGIIKAVQKDSAGKVLYTQELTRFSTGGTPPPPTAKPRITKVEPVSFKAGETVTMTITGENLSGVTAIKYGGPFDRLRFSEIKATATTVTARVTATTSPSMINPFEFGTVWVVSPAGESNSLDVLVTRP